MKRTFILSRANKIYAIIAVIIYTLVFVVSLKGNSGGLPSLFGTITGLLLIPAFIALIIWWIMGKNDKAGTNAFNIVLTISLLVSIFSISENAQKHDEALKNAKNLVSEFKEKSKENPDSFHENYSNFSSGMKSSIDELIKTSSNESKEMFISLKKYFTIYDSLNTVWIHAYNSVLDSNILNFNFLNDSKECEYQIGILQEYVNQSNKLKEFISNRTAFIKQMVSEFDQEDSRYKSVIENIKMKDSIQKYTYNLYINAHIDYGKSMIKMIEVLEKNLGEWEYNNETIIFDSDDSKVEFFTAYKVFIENELIINELSEKLIDLI